MTTKKRPLEVKIPKNLKYKKIAPNTFLSEEFELKPRKPTVKELEIALAAAQNAINYFNKERNEEAVRCLFLPFGYILIKPDRK